MWLSSQFCHHHIYRLGYFSCPAGESGLWPGPGLIRICWDRSLPTVRPCWPAAGAEGGGRLWSASVRDSLGDSTARDWLCQPHRPKTRAITAATTRMSGTSLSAPLPSAFTSSSGVSQKNFAKAHWRRSSDVISEGKRSLIGQHKRVTDRFQCKTQQQKEKPFCRAHSTNVCSLYSFYIFCWKFWK